MPWQITINCYIISAKKKGKVIQSGQVTVKNVKFWTIGLFRDRNVHPKTLFSSNIVLRRLGYLLIKNNCRLLMKSWCEGFPTSPAAYEVGGASVAAEMNGALKRAESRHASLQTHLTTTVAARAVMMLLQVWQQNWSSHALTRITSPCRPASALSCLILW